MASSNCYHVSELKLVLQCEHPACDWMKSGERREMKDEIDAHLLFHVFFHFYSLKATLREKSNSIFTRKVPDSKLPFPLAANRTTDKTEWLKLSDSDPRLGVVFCHESQLAGHSCS